MARSNQNSGGGKERARMERKQKVKKIVNGKAKLEERGYGKLFTYKATKIWPIPIPRLSNIYETRIYRVTKKGGCE